MLDGNWRTEKMLKGWGNFFFFFCLLEIFQDG